MGISTPVMAHELPYRHSHEIVRANYSQPGGSQQTKCFKRIYREEYVPGTRRNPGYVKKYNEKVRVPCGKFERKPKFNQPDYHPRSNSSNTDDNSCIEGAIIGGIAGGAAGGTLSTKENWIWSIPTGLVGGALIGCQIDGG